VNIGERVVLTETTLVFDDLGHDLLLAGTSGTVTLIKGGLFSLLTPKGIYDNIPIASAKIIEEVKAA
jgi:hypothetical protein